jgi:hypothetical protein
LAEIRGVRTNRVVGSDTDLTFHTFSNSVLGERMRIRDDGNVGIGTTTPVSRLDVTGDIRSSTGNYLTGSSTVFHGFNNGTINFGVPTNGNALVVNDIAGARYAISTGGFDLTFSKHRASDGAWLKSFTLEGDGANNNPTGFKFFVGTTEAFMMNSLGNVGINETSPSAQLQVKSGATDRPTLIVNTLASHTASVQNWQINGSNVAYMASNGALFLSTGVANLSSSANSFIATATTGTTISRNVADANPSLIVNQANTSSTGDIARFQFGGSTKSYVAKDGGFYKNETKLTLTEPAFTDLGSDVYKYTLTTSQIADNDVIEITKTADGNNEVIYVEVPDNSKNIRIIVHIKPDTYTGVIGGVNYAKAVGEYTKNIFLESTANTYEGDLAGTLIQLTYNVTNNPYVFVYENINGKLKCLTTTSIGVI